MEVSEGALLEDESDGVDPVDGEDSPDELSSESSSPSVGVEPLDDPELPEEEDPAPDDELLEGTCEGVPLKSAVVVMAAPPLAAAEEGAGVGEEVGTMMGEDVTIPSSPMCTTYSQVPSASYETSVSVGLGELTSVFT